MAIPDSTPPVRAVGDGGHVEDHNLIKAALDDIQTQLLSDEATHLPLPIGTPTAGQVPVVSTASPLALGWGSSGGGSPARAGGTTNTPAKLTYYNVLDYGATGDGTTDDSTAIQAAITACQIGAHFSGLGGAVLIPFGKYYVATGLTCTNPGTHFIGQGGPGISDELSTGSTQIIVGDGIWGLTVGTSGTSDFRGYNVENLFFFEKNTGQASGGLRIFSSSNGSYTRVAAGRFTAGTGILLDGVSDGVQAQYNQFSDCRVGKNLIGFEQRHANGTRWIGGYADGSHNGQTPTASTVGFKITSGDTFRSIGTVIQGYDTLIDVGSGGGTCFDAEFQNTRMEVWGTAAIRVRATVASAKFHGGGDNSLNSNSGAGAIIDAGATDTVMGAVFTNVRTLYTDNGTRTRYPATAGLAKGAAVAGTLVGQFPQYDNTGTLIGYAPLYDSITGIYLVQDLGGTVNGTTGVTTVTRTLTAPANVGDMVVVGGGYGSASTRTVTITDSRSNTWTTNRHDDMTTGATPHSFVGSTVLTTGLQVGDTITATFSGTVNYPMIFAYDYAGQISGTIVDTSGGATGTGTAASTGNITTTTDYPLQFGVVYFDQAAGVITGGSGFTVYDQQSSTSKRIAVEAKNGIAAGTAVGADATLGSSVDWAMSVVAFKKAAGTTPATDPRYDVAGAASTAQAASLQKSSNLSDLASATTARTNLGLGTAATQASSAFLQTANNLSDVTAATARTNLGLGTAATQATATFLQTSNNLSDVTAATARTNLGLGTAATSASTAFDAAGAATAVKGLPLALTGATAASRYVGGTASGAPVSGTFAVGDFITTGDGKIFVCSSAGTPGTWVQSGGAASLTSSSNILGADVTMTTNGTYYDGPTLTLAAGTYLVIGAAQLLAATSAVRTWVSKLWDGTNSPLCVATSQIAGTAAAGQASLSVAAIVSPGSSTTYKISSTSTVNADTFRGTSTTGSYLIAVKIA